MRTWRVFATGIGFTVFYGMCLFAIPAIVVCHLLARDESDRARRVQGVFHATFRLYIAFVERLGVIRTEQSGFEQLGRRTGVLIIANHPTLLDVVLVIARLRAVDCVVKRSLWRSYFTRACVAGAAYIANDGGSAVIDTCIARLKLGRNVLLFPEGTRSPPGGLQPFQRGVARIALGSGADIVPVFIACSPPVFTKGSKWYQVPARKPCFTLRVAPALSPRPWIESQVARPLAVRELTHVLRSGFERQIDHDGA